MPPQRRHVRSGHPGLAYPQRVIEKALLLRRKKKWSFQKIADQLHVPDASTVWRWTQHSMTPPAQALRTAAKGGAKLLTAEQESIAKGWLTYRHAQFLHTDSKRFRLFLHRLVGHTPSKAWLSKFLRRVGQSTRIVQPTNPALINPKAREEGIRFLTQLHGVDKHPSQFVFADKISFGIAKHGVKEIAAVGSGTIHRAHAEHGVPIHVYTSLVPDGSTGAFFAVVARKRGVREVIPDEEGSVKLIGRKKGRGEVSVLAFLEDAVRRGTLQRGDVLVTDNDNCWKTEDVRHYVAAHNIAQLFYPKYLGARLDPCDNSLHAAFRRRYQAEALQKGHMTLEERLVLLNRVYHEIPERVVTASVRHCGLMEGDPEHIMDELLHEGAQPSGGLTAQMRRDVIAYLDFEELTNEADEDVLPAQDSSESCTSDEESSNSNSDEDGQ